MYVPSHWLHRFVEGAADNLFLLLGRELVEVDRVSRHANGEIGIKLGVLHSVYEFLAVENIDVDVVCIAVEVSAKDI